MAVVTGDFLAGVLTSFRALFNRDFAAARSVAGWQQLAINMDSAGESNSYTWFGTVPRMEDTTHDTLSLHDLPEFDFTITNREWKTGIAVKKAALERDPLSLIAPRISQLAEEAARHPGELMLTLVEDNPVAFDGITFFNDTRVIGESANIDNEAAGTGTTVAQVQTDLETVAGTMQRFEDDRGRPMNLAGNTIMIPPELRATMFRALNATQAGTAGPTAGPAPAGNVFAGAGYTVVVNPYLTDVNDWYLMHIGGPARRPFIYQTEVAPRLLSDTNPNTARAIETGEFIYAVEGRYNVGVTDPRFAIHVTNT